MYYFQFFLSSTFLLPSFSFFLLSFYLIVHFFTHIELDPGIFTGILKELGVKGIEVEELYSLDESLLRDLNPVHALVFLFKWINHPPSDVAGTSTSLLPENAYFANQVITNACATLALLNATLNIEEKDGIEIGEELANLKDFSNGLDAESKGWTISNSEKIRSGKVSAS